MWGRAPLLALWVLWGLPGPATGGAAAAALAGHRVLRPPTAHFVSLRHAVLAPARPPRPPPHRRERVGAGVALRGVDPPPPVAARPPPLPRLAALALLLLSAAAAVTRGRRRPGVRRAEWQALGLVGTETPAGTDEGGAAAGPPIWPGAPAPHLRVLRFWFGGEYAENHRGKWFAAEGSPAQSETDRHIREEFGPLLREAEAGRLEGWRAEPSSCLALIVVLDQFSRHAYRDLPDRDARVAGCDRLAVQYAEAALAEDWVPLLPVDQRMFLLMPLRHSPTPERMRRVIQEIDRLGQRQSDMGAMLDKFRRATVRRLHHMEGLQYREGDEILEHHPFQADERDLTRHKLYIAMEEFLKRCHVSRCRALAVSLSGGVDSMVIAKLLTAARSQLGGFTILALHVDYANRAESGAEAAFVRRWCEERGIEFRQRVIAELKRLTTPREVYERATRDIRFGFYRAELDRSGAPAVMFGHHQGDLQENVICNLMRHTQLLDIAGMREVDSIQGVDVWRPLLAFPKADIFEFAHKYGVPYLKDTTGRWSTRGAMRNDLMPLLQDMFGAGYLDNLSALARQSADMAALVHGHVLDPFLQRVQTSPLAVWVDCAECVDRPVVFWKVVLKHLGEKVLGIGLFSEGPIKSFMKKLQASVANPEDPNRRFGTVNLKAGQHFYLFGATLIYLRPGVVPGAALFPREGPLDSAAGQVTRGPYTIRLERVRDVPDAVAEARVTAAQFLSGQFCYYLPYGLQLELTKDRAARPEALRGIPRALLDLLPLVCCRPKSGRVVDGEYHRVSLETAPGHSHVPHTDRDPLSRATTTAAPSHTTLP